MPPTKRRYRVNSRYRGHYVQSWREGRGRNAECIVLIWANACAPDGEPDGEWAMPGDLSDQAAIDQAILQTDACRGGA